MHARDPVIQDGVEAGVDAPSVAADEDAMADVALRQAHGRPAVRGPEEQLESTSSPAESSGLRHESDSEYGTEVIRLVGARADGDARTSSWMARGSTL